VGTVVSLRRVRAIDEGESLYDRMFIKVAESGARLGVAGSLGGSTGGLSPVKRAKDAIEPTGSGHRRPTQDDPGDESQGSTKCIGH
jgi:hypothetical protein